MIDKLGLDGLGGASVRKPKVVGKLDALVEAAKAATPGPWHSPGLGEVHAENHDVLLDVLFNDGSGEDSVGNGRQVDADYVALANPATILELCALLEKAEDAAKAFKTARDQADQYGHLVEASSDIAEAYYQADRMNDEAITAIKQWKEKT